MRKCFLLIFICGAVWAGDERYHLELCQGWGVQEARSLYFSLVAPVKGQAVICPSPNVDMLEYERDIISQIAYERDLRVVNCEREGGYFRIGFLFNPGPNVPRPVDYNNSVYVVLDDHKKCLGYGAGKLMF